VALRGAEGAVTFEAALKVGDAASGARSRPKAAQAAALLTRSREDLAPAARGG